MNIRMWILVAAALLVLQGGSGHAQEPNARAVLEAALKAMGGENMESIQWTATGFLGQPGQSYSPWQDWPADVFGSYTRTIDYGARSSKEDFVLKQGSGREGSGGAGPLGGGNQPIITNPFQGERRESWMVSGNYAWNVEGSAVVPKSEDAELRQLNIWLTPHGCVKGGPMPGANPIAVTRNEAGKGRITAVSFLALGKYRVQCAIDEQSLVERIQTWIPNPVVGDLYYENVLGNYRDFGNGVKFPSGFHIHHDLDDDLEGGGVNVSGGHNAFGLTISAVQVNVSAPVLAVPEQVRQATVAPVRVESQKMASGVWYLGGGTHASVAVEFRDFIAVVEAPLNEERSLAVIAEVKRLIPSKPIRYLVITHHHWDSIGGVRAYVHQEAPTLLLQQLNLAYLTEVLWIRPWILKPDRLSLFPPEEVAEGYTFETVGQKFVVSDGTRMMELYNVSSPHATGMLMAYLPQEKILIESDLFTPSAPNTPSGFHPFSTNLNNRVQGLKLDVTTIAPLKGTRQVPWSDFASVVSSANKPGQ